MYEFTQGISKNFYVSLWLIQRFCSERAIKSLLYLLYKRDEQPEENSGLTAGFNSELRIHSDPLFSSIPARNTQEAGGAVNGYFTF